MLINNAGFGIAGAIRTRATPRRTRSSRPTSSVCISLPGGAATDAQARRAGRQSELARGARRDPIPGVLLRASASGATQALRMEMAVRHPRQHGQPGDFAASFTDNRQMVAGSVEGSASCALSHRGGAHAGGQRKFRAQSLTLCSYAR